MSMSFLLWGAKNWTEHFGWAEQRGRSTSLDLLVNALPSTDQDSTGLLCCRGALLTHGQLAAHQNPQVSFCKVAFQLVDLQPILQHSVIPSPVQDFAELNEIPTCPFLQPVTVPFRWQQTHLICQPLLPIVYHL